MKMAKRMLSLVLALVMLASLSVPAFADTPAKPYVQVTIEKTRDGETDSWTVPATAGESVKAALDAKDAQFHPVWTSVPDYYDPSQSHSMLTAYGRTGGTAYGKVGFNKQKAKDVEYLKAAGYTDELINSIEWCSGIYEGYGLVTKNEAANEYTYVYAGYDWTYTNDSGDQIWDYMCCYKPAANEVIELTYTFTVTDPWVRDTPLGQ